MTIQNLKDKNLIIFECISGSNAYGTALPTSDIDIKGVFIQPIDEILSGNYIEQVSDEKNDTVYYEILRFLELAITNNPNILELFNMPDDCIRYKHPIFDLVLQNKDKFITKNCKNTFGGYAHTQIKKARGLNKKIVNPVAKRKKTPIDFCYVVEGYKTRKLGPWLKENNLEQKFCGLVNIPNAKNLYALFYDTMSYMCFSQSVSKETREQAKKIKRELGQAMGLGYKGIVKEDENGKFYSDDLRLSSVPKGEILKAIISYNKDGYMSYCKKYTEYWDWVEKRNPVRYGETVQHGNNFDAKNMMHCHRLLDMALEIGQGKDINVRRPNREQLLSIRRGEYDYDTLIREAEDKLIEVDKAFEVADLPKHVDRKFVDQLLIKIRKQFGQ